MTSLTRYVLPGDGARIRVCYRTGASFAPPLLIVLPFGVPAKVADVALHQLGYNRTVVTWETRYILDLELEFQGNERLSPTTHADDVAAIVRTLELGPCDLLGYCSGAGIALLAATRHQATFGKLLLINGEYQLFRHGHTSTEYQRSIDTFMPVVATGRAQSRFIFSKMAEINAVSQHGPQTDLDEQMSRPFRHEETLFRYAKNYIAYRDFRALPLAETICQPTFLVTGDKDIHSSAENTEAVADAIAGSRLFVSTSGDHYEFCRDGSETLAEIRAYLEQTA